MHHDTEDAVEHGHEAGNRRQEAGRVPARYPTGVPGGAVTHAELRELQHNPPEWLKELRLHGPHPRPEVARKLGISITALKKHDMDRPLTTEEISELLKDQPDWLREARAAHAAQRGDAEEA